ncbi:MAG: D-alanine--D-alanine ligase [Candidatus Binatia bacterium]
MKKLRFLVLMHPSLLPPDTLEGYTEKEAYVWKTEYDVVMTLRRLGHEVRPLGLADELAPLRLAITEWKPHLVFNLLEEFHGLTEFDQHVVSYLELLQTHYTGSNPRGLVLARDKALSKKLLVYHRIPVPAFVVFPRGRKIRLPRDLLFPLIVKCLKEEASRGIAQASIVDNEEKLKERVGFIHESMGSDAIVEQFIKGRELYVGVIGNKRLEVLPTWELVFENLPPGSAAIATARIKHNPEYQEKWGIYQQPAADLSLSLLAHIVRTTKRIYRILQLDGYARIDYRLGPTGELYFLEANPNPEIAEREEFASAAQAAGLPYPELLQKILQLGLRRKG